jgi:hypothetical protein
LAIEIDSKVSLGWLAVMVMGGGANPEAWRYRTFFDNCVIIGCKKFLAPPSISWCDKQSDSFLMSFCVVFAIIHNDIFNSFTQVGGDGLKLFQGHFTYDLSNRS